MHNGVKGLKLKQPPKLRQTSNFDGCLKIKTGL